MLIILMLMMMVAAADECLLQTEQDAFLCLSNKDKH